MSTKRTSTSKTCAAKVCRALIDYTIDPETCIGCTRCARNCPVNAITGTPREAHVIDPEICIRCGICAQVCPVNAYVEYVPKIGFKGVS